MIKVCKFGGTSMADGNVICAVKKIIESDETRRVIVVSAPGKRYSGDKKVTDMLFAVHAELKSCGNISTTFPQVKNRFIAIAEQLKLTIDIEDILNNTQKRIIQENNESFTISRGEYLSAIILANYLNAKFIDAEGVVFFDERGQLDGEKTYRAVAKSIPTNQRAVMSGFYGVGVDGRVKTFSRGGSDISGAIAARAVSANVYENWTDVSGFLASDPRIVDNPKHIKSLSYKELRELSYMGADVLHSESIFPVRKANIPILIKNTFRPDDEGTYILPTSQYIPCGNVITGIAGKKNFTVIYVEKSLMNSEIGFMRKVLSVVEGENVPLEHIPSGIDTMSLVIPSDSLVDGKLQRIVADIKTCVEPDVLKVIENIALIAVVGHGMSSTIGTASRIFKAVSEAGVNIRMIDQGTAELNIVLGVKNDDYNKTIKAIYKEFFK